MTLSDALSEMELVGHDFYLFHDIDTDRAERVYRRHGWSYGVLHLDLDGSLADGSRSAATRRRCRGGRFLRELSGAPSGQSCRGPATMCPCTVTM